MAAADVHGYVGRLAFLHSQRARRLGRFLFLQGVERGRAFSFAINETTGFVSAAVARDGLTVAVFGACTPATAEESK